MTGHQNIWGSPVRDANQNQHHHAEQEDGLKGLLRMLQTPKSTPTVVSSQDL